MIRGRNTPLGELLQLFDLSILSPGGPTVRPAMVLQQGAELKVGGGHGVPTTPQVTGEAKWKDDS